MASDSSTVVEQSLQHSKVKGLSHANAAGIRKEKMAKIL